MIVNYIIGTEVYVLKIEHRHGNNISIFSSDVKAKESLFLYVKDNWDKDFLGKIPRKKDKAIDKYFERTGDECFDIFSTEIE